MGDLCDMNDLGRFMRSDAGKEHLEGIVSELKGNRIVAVSFSNEIHSLMTVLHLSDGSRLEVFQAEHEVERLRDNFAQVIQEEYNKDYPERRQGT